MSQVPTRTLFSTLTITAAQCEQSPWKELPARPRCFQDSSSTQPPSPFQELCKGTCSRAVERRRDEPPLFRFDRSLPIQVRNQCPCRRESSALSTFDRASPSSQACRSA